MYRLLKCLLWWTKVTSVYTLLNISPMAVLKFRGMEIEVSCRFTEARAPAYLANSS